MRRFVSLLLLLSVVCAARDAISAQTPTVKDSRGDAAILFDGVKAVGEPGTVGQIALWGDEAFAIVVGKEGDARVPIIAASQLGKGRIIACAHGFASDTGVHQLDTGAFIVNAGEWLSGGNGERRAAARALRIGLLKCDLEEFLQGEGVTTVDIAGGANLAQQLQQANVRAVLCNKADLSSDELKALESYVRSGGGFLCCACPWGWAQTHKQPVHEIPLNRLLEKAGLALIDGTADATREKGFVVDAQPGPEFNATSALKVLGEVEAGSLKANDPIVRQAGATLLNASPALPSNDRLLRPKLELLLKEHADQLAPTSNKPLKQDRPLDRALLAMQVAETERLPAKEIHAHPTAATFPGAPPADAKRIARVIDVDLSVPNWHSTGLYAAPGEVIGVEFVGQAVESAVKTDLRLRIGCHRDELWKADAWQRVPRITQSWLIDANRFTAASAFGGLIYIETPAKTSNRMVSLRIEGAVEAPLFILGETTNAQWASAIRNRPAPWAELACNRLILTIPSSVAKNIDDPQAVMEHWVKVLDADAELAGIPHERVRPERIVADVQISAGYMHSGYPIMAHLDAATFMTDLAKLGEHGWGPYHELGHNHQQGDWTFAGTTEVTCNLFSLYVLDTVCGTPPDKCGRVLDAKSFEKMHKYLSSSEKWKQWKDDPFLAPQMYALMQRDFGWDAFKKVFAEYRVLPRDERPKSDEQKRDQWLTRFSRTVGRNLGPYFEAWGVPTTPAARDSIKDLPAWMPAEMQKNKPKPSS